MEALVTKNHPEAYQVLAQCVVNISTISKNHISRWKRKAFPELFSSGDLYPYDLRKLLQKIRFYDLRFILFKSWLSLRYKWYQTTPQTRHYDIIRANNLPWQILTGKKKGYKNLDTPYRKVNTWSPGFYVFKKVFIGGKSQYQSYLSWEILNSTKLPHCLLHSFFNI